jgi:hypothetical protein
LLHHAAWVDDPRIVERLIERGADPVSHSGAEYDRPLAWAALGSQHDALPDRDYVAVVEALVAAGAELEERFTEVAQGRWPTGLTGKSPLGANKAVCLDAGSEPELTWRGNDHQKQRWRSGCAA